MKKLAIVAVLLACGSKSDPKDDPKNRIDKLGGAKIGEKEPAPVETKTDPACAKGAAELEPYLTTLYLEAASAEINMGWKPQVIDRTATPLEWDTVDWGVITPEMKAVFDASEANHVDNKLGAGADRLKQTFEMKVEKKANHAKLRLDVDQSATWGDVVAVVDAASAAGYTDLTFAFETESKLAPPPGVEARTSDTAAFDKARADLAALHKKCAPLTDVGLDSLKATKADTAKARGANTAKAIAKCNCAVKPEEIKAAIWKTERWHQAHTRAGLDFKLAADGTAIEEAAATPWSTAHTKLLSMSGAIKLVAK